MKRAYLKLWVVITSLFMAGSATAAELALYGNFHAMGVIITLGAGEDPEQNAAVLVEYRSVGGPFRQAYPPARVDGLQFTGSLFFLDPGTSYDVQVTFTDPGGVLDGVVLSSTAATRSEIVISPAGNSYYVSPNGSGSACTAGSPCALSQGIALAQSGDEIVLTGGTYYQGGLAFPRSGTAAAPITIRGAADQTAVISGADPATLVWTPQGQGVYRTVINVPNTHLVTVDGQRLFPYDSLTNLQGLVYQVPGFYCDGTTLSIHLANDADPNAHLIQVSRYNYGFIVERDYIYFTDLTFTHFGQGSWAKAIYFNNASNNLVRGCTFAVNDLGIGLKRSCSRNLMEYNEFYDTIFQWPWHPVKEVSNLETGGVRFYDPLNGRGNVIRHNTFHDYFDGFGCGTGSTNQVTNETDVYGNLVYNTGDDGVEVDGRAANVRLWDNTFHDVLMGISLAPVYDGPVYAVRNLIYRTGAGNSEYTGSPFKFNSGYSLSGPMFLFHNTCDAVLAGNNGIYIKAPGTWEKIVSRNNIWSGTDYALNNYNTSQPLDFDYDVLYTSRSAEYVYWDAGGDRHMRDLATFQSRTGQEQNGLDIMPEFMNAAAGDYRPAAGALFIDRGVVLPGINDNFSGSAPDMGAFESISDCMVDKDSDGDVDGHDLALLAAQPDMACLGAFAARFGL